MRLNAVPENLLERIALQGRATGGLKAERQ